MTFFEKKGKLFNAAFSVLKGIQTNAKSGADVASLIPQMDELISSQSGAFIDQQSAVTELDPQIKAKILDFVNRKSRSIMVLYKKEFEAYNKSLDYLGERIKVTTDGLFKGVENAKSDMIAALSDKQMELANKSKQQTTDYKESLKALENSIVDTELQLKRKFDSEVVRLTDHFTNLMKQKEETLELTKASLEKAQNELKVATEECENEVKALIMKNNEILREHAEAMMMRIADDEKKAEKLERDYNEIFKTHSTFGPEFDRQWRQRQQELQYQFEEEHSELERTIANMEEKLVDTKSLLKSAKEEYESQKLEFDEEVRNMENVYRKNIQSVVAERPQKINDAAKSAHERCAQKEERLRETLLSMKEKIARDTEEMKNKINAKAVSHKDKLRSLRDDQIKKLKQINDESDSVAEKIKYEREIWPQQRQELIDQTDKEIEEIKSKAAAEQRYFEARYAGLEDELNRIINENSNIQPIKALGNLKETEDRMRKEEADLENKLYSEMNAKINRAVRHKLAQLRKKHRHEKAKLKAKVKKLENTLYNASSLPANRLINSKVKFSNESKQSLIKGEEEDEEDVEDDPKRTTPSYPTQQFQEASMQKWREDQLLNAKTIKQQQIIAIKRLDESRKEFQAAVDRLTALKESLIIATHEYEQALQDSQNKGDEEIKEMQKVIEQKEQIISRLEDEFEHNERDLKIKARQIEQVEDKLSHLQENMENSKMKIKEKIKLEYQPILVKEQEISDKKINELRKLQTELELQLECMKNDLFSVESANAGMEETIRKETDEMIVRLRNDLRAKCIENEANYSAMLKAKGEQKLEEIAVKVLAMEDEERQLISTHLKERQMMEYEHSQRLQRIRDEHDLIRKENGEKEAMIRHLSSLKCEMCGSYARKIRKLEKEIVQLQYVCRDTSLVDENNRNTFRTFRPLPPLSG